MPVETVLNTSPAKEPPATRRRSADAGATADGQGFSLPQTEDAAAAAAESACKVAGDAKASATAPQAGAAAKAAGNAAGPDKSAVAADASPRLPAGQASSFLEALAELLAAAEGGKAPAEGERTEEVGTKGKAAKKDADGKQVGEGSADKVEGADDAAADKATGDATIIVLPADQKPAVQAPATILSLSLPVAAGSEATAGDEVVQSGDPATRAASKGRIQVEAALAAGASKVGHASLSKGQPADKDAQASSAPVAAGEHSAAAGETHKSGAHEASADATAPLAKLDAVQGAPITQGTPTAPADPKLAEAAKQALAPIDLGALVQQALGAHDSTRLLSPLDQAVGAANQTPGGGQGQAAAVPTPTPLHVLPIEIGLRALSGARQFDIRLDPDELGRVDVNLSISDKGEVSARLVVDRVETLHLLQRDARTLERAFEQAGLRPSDGGVDISLRDPSDQSSFRQQRQHDEPPQRARQPSRGETGDDNTVLPITPAPQRRIVRLGGVDLSI
ncbi:flagellar hook-length control protein FliK [Bosea sp. (in: a-proteobacteria)]|uniref:flagellar hook-length control protein FliK n=1 Tax=Bosea sp. (in: a-proteobacteria) TaxID=1871050 RepID=UPI001AC62F61|nr:flagellar hook-length control protein FliK [Bosea sp. (in: a-proteobacteria)]MBN9441188.1 flagellar hook-length control protein FliK [Bosea sp. (in: a-proteobacteria)]